MLIYLILIWNVKIQKSKVSYCFTGSKLQDLVPNKEVGVQKLNQRAEFCFAFRVDNRVVGNTTIWEKRLLFYESWLWMVHRKTTNQSPQFVPHAVLKPCWILSGRVQIIFKLHVLPMEESLIVNIPLDYWLPLDWMLDYCANSKSRFFSTLILLI